MTSNPTISQEKYSLELLFDHVSSYEVMSNLPEQDDFKADMDYRDYRRIVSAYSTPTEYDENDCSTIRQSATPNKSKTAFVRSELKYTICVPNIGTFAYNKSRVIKGDIGFLADRDGKIADSHILIVEELLAEVYLALKTRDASAFTKAK